MSEQSKDNHLEKKITLVVTDSGLGGFSVFNDIAGRLVKRSPWQNVQLIYVNAWPAPHRGYNHFKTEERRARIFNNALKAMAAFQPDRILIACNTLSVIYPQTQFAQNTPVPVEGIVDHGIQMLYEKLSADPDSKAIVLGTPATAAAKSHEKGLVKKGITKDRIINVGCTDLAGFIEREPFSIKVEQTIHRFIKETGEQMDGFSGNIHAALCCTHFGYRQDIFTNAFQQYFNEKVTILNPNIRMADQVFAGMDSLQDHPVDIRMKVISKAVWGAEQISAYQKLIPNMPEQIKEALQCWEHNDELFLTD